MFSMRWRLFLIVVIGQMIIVAARNSEKPSNRLKKISELQSEYLSNEGKLWHRIERILNNTQHIDENDVNKTMIDALKIHRSVFYENTFETNSYWRSYLLYRIENFRDYLSNINDTLEENYKFLYDGSEQIIYKRSDTKLWARDTMFQRLKENSDGLFNLTVFQKDTILEHIQTVSFSL